MQSKYDVEIPEESHYTVYKLTDPEGKVYIGCTGQTVERRWQKGWGYSKDRPIRRAIDALGWEAFKKEILCENLTKEGAEKLEKWFVEYYDSMDPAKGYNGMTGGARAGAKMSESAKNKSSNSHKKAFEDNPQFAANMRKMIKTKWQEAEYRNAITESNKAFYCQRPDRALARRKMKNAHYEAKPELKEQISRSLLEYYKDPANHKSYKGLNYRRPVMCVETGDVFPSQREAVRTTGFQSVPKVCKGINTTCGGYHWRYLTEEEKEQYFGGA